MRIQTAFFFFFFNDTATTEIYTLSLHDALPISGRGGSEKNSRTRALTTSPLRVNIVSRMISSDRKSTRLNSSHSQISYAVFCLKKKKKSQKHNRLNTHPESHIDEQCLHVIPSSS